MEKAWERLRLPFEDRQVVLLRGATGTGKTTMARQLHQAFTAQAGPFIDVNLASLCENLFESELFGHVKGSFTGAIDNKRGHCDLVGEGTLFLDEIGEVSLANQKKLLQLIEDRTYQPVGSCVKKAFKGRIILATHQGLELLVGEKKFRQDLYFRIRVFQVDLPCLSSSPRLVVNAVKKILEELSFYGQVPPAVMERLFQHQWPGNFRELKNILVYAFFEVKRKEKSIIELGDLPEWLQFGASQSEATPSPKAEENLAINFSDALASFEKKYFDRLLDLCAGKINESARKGGLSKVTLIAKIRKYGIDTGSFKQRGK